MSRPGRTGRPWRRLRQQILANNNTCWICGLPGATTIDHVIPLSRGGHPTDPNNLRPAHHRCNSRRGDTLPHQPTSRTW